MTENSTRYYTNSEIDLLIGEISEAAHDAIEKAAGEAARAAFLESVEREAMSLREAAYQQAEALRWKMEADVSKKETKAAIKTGRKNTIIGAAIGVFSGLALGMGGIMLISK